MARPSFYSPELVTEICERIADGQSIRELCRAEDMPSRDTVRRWLRDHEDFAQLYARAWEQRTDAWLEETFDIADDASNDWMDRRRADGTIERVPDPEQVARSKLRIATRHWAMAKCAPKKYGQKVELSGNPDQPLIPTDAINVARRVAFMLASGAAAKDRPSES